MHLFKRQMHMYAAFSKFVHARSYHHNQDFFKPVVSGRRNTDFFSPNHCFKSASAFSLKAAMAFAHNAGPTLILATPISFNSFTVKKPSPSFNITLSLPSNPFTSSLTSSVLTPLPFEPPQTKTVFAPASRYLLPRSIASAMVPSEPSTSVLALIAKSGTPAFPAASTAVLIRLAASSTLRRFPVVLSTSSMLQPTAPSFMTVVTVSATSE